MITRSLYLLTVPQFDAIVRMSFFKENEVDTAGLEKRIVEVSGSKIPMAEGEINMKESLESVEMIGMIPRIRLRRSSGTTKLRSSSSDSPSTLAHTLRSTFPKYSYTLSQ